MKLFFCLFLYTFGFLYGTDRSSSWPYISGDSFRAFSDFVYDEISKDVNPQKVQTGSVIFVKTDYVEEFFAEIHPLINNRYILVTHNSDYSAPRNCASYLDDDKLIVWFGQNVTYNHPKLHPIPIGIANKCWGHGNTKIIQEIQEATKGSERSILLYMNFAIGTYFEERNKVAALFSPMPYCSVSSPKEFAAYLVDLSETKFVLSPRGNGLDCHRTWESLLMGAIPIVRTSSIDSLYEDLPVIIIEDWETINEEFLEKRFEEMKNIHFNLDKMYINYWYALIESYKTK